MLAEQQVLISCWKHTRLKQQSLSTPTNGLIILTKHRIQNFHRETRFTVNCVTGTLLKLITWIMSTYWKLGWPQNKLLTSETIKASFNWKWVLWKTATAIQVGGKWSHSKIFSVLKQQKHCANLLGSNAKLIGFYNDQNIDVLKLSCKIPKLSNNCLHKSTWAKFYPFREAHKGLLDKSRQDVVGGPSVVYSRKAIAIETLIRSPQTNADQL